MRLANGLLKFQQEIFAVINIFIEFGTYEGWNFNSGNYLFTTDTK